MNRLRASTATMVLLLALGGTSCRKSKAVVTPATPAAPPKVLTLPERKAEPPPEIPPAPEIPAQSVESISPPDVVKPQPITVRPPGRRAASRPPQGPVTPSVPAPSAPTGNGTGAPGVPAVPQLKPMLTVNQERQLQVSIERRLDRARQVVKSMGGRQLSQQQAATIQQIQTFIQQSEDERKADLVRANNLAERADVLSQDLQKGLP